MSKQYTMSKSSNIVKDTIRKYGNCESLISIDPNFKEISISLFVKDNIATVWSFSKKKGVDQRIEQIRNQLIHLGGMIPVPNTHNQAQFPNGDFSTARLIKNLSGLLGSLLTKKIKVQYKGDINYKVFGFSLIIL